MSSLTHSVTGGLPRNLVISATNLRRYLEDHPETEESQLWSRLRGDQLGLRVRQQSPIPHPKGDMIVDFYIAKRHLVIELGDRDLHRQDRLEDLGLHVLWIPRDLVKTDLDYVVSLVKSHL